MSKKEEIKQSQWGNYLRSIDGQKAPFIPFGAIIDGTLPIVDLLAENVYPLTSNMYSLYPQDNEFREEEDAVLEIFGATTRIFSMPDPNNQEAYITVPIKIDDLKKPMTKLVEEMQELYLQNRAEPTEKNHHLFFLRRNAYLALGGSSITTNFETEGR